MAEKEIFSVATEPTFTPFWRRLPRFFFYPMQLGPMLRMGLGALVCAFGLFMGVFGFLIALFIFLAFLKYSFVVLERTATGRFDEPNNMNGEEGGEISQVFRMIGFFIILGIVLGLLKSFLGTVGEDLNWVLVNILPPAGIMIIATSHSLARALNPAQIFFYIRTIGSPYLALCFLLLSLTESSLWLQMFLDKHVDSWVVVPLIIFVQLYFILIIYHMMGYVIYQYHDKLGLQAAVSFEKAEAQLSPNKPAPDPIMAQLGALMAEGKEQEAASMLREELRTKWERNDLHERYQKLLVALGKHDVALLHARDFIGKLVMEKRMFQALDLCEWGLKTDPAFQLGNPDHVHELAAAANVANRHKLALDLMRGFDKRYPGHKHTAPVYLLSAKILAEKYHKYVEAGKILRALQAKFPGHELATEAKKYQEAFAKLEAIG
jgi:hypothetical protein